MPYGPRLTNYPTNGDQKLNHALEESLLRWWPLENWCEHRLIVAVSGGADSVALLRALANISRQADQTESKSHLLVAHFNHGWRGDESDEDELFVANLADQLGMKFICERANQPVDANHESKSNSGHGAEAIARDLRYAFLESTAKKHGARHLVTAHNQNDQVETIVHRILRGTGISGLRGIPAVRNLGDGISIVRPLLSANRESIHEYLESIGQTFRVDSSNSDLRYTRNRIRNEILPALEKLAGEQLSANILQLSEHASETQSIIDDCCERLSAKAVSIESSDRVTIDCTELADQPQYLICELLRSIWKHQQWPQRDMNSVRWQKLAAMIFKNEENARQTTMPGDIRISRQRGTLSLQRYINPSK